MYEGLNDKKKWGLITTHPGKITENCLAGDTIVVTSTGNKKLSDVCKSDLLWDGVEWVSHDGIICKGVQEVLSLDGVWMTPDHRVMCSEGEWKNAEIVESGEATSAFEKHFGRGFRLSDCGILRGEQREGFDLERYLRMWKPHFDGRFRVSEKIPEVLRLQARYDDRVGKSNARHDRASCLCGMEVDVSTMPERKALSLEKLWRSWDYSVRRMADIFSVFLVRHGPKLSTGDGSGSKRQLSGVLQGELSLGYEESKFEKYSVEPSRRHPVGKSHDSRSGGEVRDKIYNPALPNRSQGSKVDVVRTCRRHEQVFDIVNAGPRTRFTVLDGHGRPFIVHNCVQAVARDILFHGAMLAHKKRRTDIRLRIHDQLVALAPAADAEEQLKLLIEDMTTVPPWAPGLILGAAGAVSRVFKKD